MCSQRKPSLFWQTVWHGSKEFVCNAGDLGSNPGFGRSPGERNGNPLQYYCLENSMDRGVWQATVHGVAKSRTQLSDYHFHALFFVPSVHHFSNQNCILNKNISLSLSV